MEHNNITRILFVCLGNICRSPMAETIMQKLAADRGVQHLFDIDSAGTYGGHAGELPDARMRQHAATHGYKMTHRSRQVKTDDFDNFDLIVAMDDSNYHNLCRLAPTIDAQNKIVKMIDFCTTNFDYDYIPDPYYEGSEGFKLVIRLLEDACDGLLKSLLNKQI